MSTTHAGHINEEWPFSRSTAPASTNHMELLATLAVIFIFILVCIHVYARFRQRHQSVVITIQRNRVPAMPAPHPDDAASTGLDAASIAALPTFIYRFGLSPAKNKPFEECAVCLSVPEEGEMMRMLPNCKHLFHIECIDMWLQSHSTCPVCRTTAKPPFPPLPPRKAELGELLASPPLGERLSGVEAVVREDGVGPSQGARSETREDGAGPSQGSRSETREEGVGLSQGSRRETREDGVGLSQGSRRDMREAEDDHDVDLERQ